MDKLIDRFALKIILFVFLWLWSYYLLRSVVWSGIIALSLTAIIFIILHYIVKRKKAHFSYTAEKLAKDLAIKGSGKALALYLKQLSIDFDGKSPSFIVNDTLYFCAFKFSDCSKDDIASAFRIAEASQLDKIVFITKSISRDAALLASGLPVSFTFVRNIDLYKKLKANHALPELIKMNKPVNHGFEFKNFVTQAFSASNTKYYVFSGVLLGIMCFITPMKLYYIIMSSFMMLMAMLTVIIPAVKANK